MESGASVKEKEKENSCFILKDHTGDDLLQ